MHAVNQKAPQTYIIAKDPKVLSRLLTENLARNINPSLYTTPASAYNTLAVQASEIKEGLSNSNKKILKRADHTFIGVYTADPQMDNYFDECCVEDEIKSLSTRIFDLTHTAEIMQKHISKTLANSSTIEIFPHFGLFQNGRIKSFSFNDKTKGKLKKKKNRLRHALSSYMPELHTYCDEKECLYSLGIHNQLACGCQNRYQPSVKSIFLGGSLERTQPVFKHFNINSCARFKTKQLEKYRFLRPFSLENDLSSKSVTNKKCFMSEEDVKSISKVAKGNAVFRSDVSSNITNVVKKSLLNSQNLHLGDSQRQTQRAQNLPELCDTSSVQKPTGLHGANLKIVFDDKSKKHYVTDRAQPFLKQHLNSFMQPTAIMSTAKDSQVCRLIKVLL